MIAYAVVAVLELFRTRASAAARQQHWSHGRSILCTASFLSLLFEMASFSYFATGVRRMAHAALRGLYLALVQRCERHSALNSVLPELIRP